MTDAEGHHWLLNNHNSVVVVVVVTSRSVAESHALRYHVITAHVGWPLLSHAIGSGIYASVNPDIVIIRVYVVSIINAVKKKHKVSRVTSGCIAMKNW